MSVLLAYLNWANSILNEIGCQIEGISSIQEGKALCQLIDLLHPDANLIKNIQGSDEPSALSYIQAVTEHMTENGIKYGFTVQDILDGDIKSMLDILWLIILNYGIHNIGKAVHERSVGAGKKLLLEWSQKELQVEFDPRQTLTHNLCSDDCFQKILKIYAHVKELPQDKVEEVRILLKALDSQLGINHELINPPDVIEGTLEEHNLMIYISLLRRKVGADELDFSEDSLERPSQKSTQKESNSANSSPHLDKKKIRLLSAGDVADDNSDWFSSSNGSAKSGSQYTGDPNVTPEGETLLIQTITESVQQHVGEGEEEEGYSSISALSGSVSAVSTLQSKEEQTSDSQTDKTSAEDKEKSEAESGRLNVEELTGGTDQTAAKEIVSSQDTCEEISYSVKEPLETISIKRPRASQTILAEAKYKMGSENRQQGYKGMDEEGKSEDEISLKYEDLYRRSNEQEAQSHGNLEGVNTSHTGQQGAQPMFGTIPPQYYPGIGKGMPIFVVPGTSSTSPEMMFILQALRQARHEANFHDQELNGNGDETSVKSHDLLNLEEVDDFAPSVIPQTPSKSRNSKSVTVQEPTESKQTMKKKLESPARSSPDPQEKANQYDFKSGKRGILEVVSESLEPRPEILDLSKSVSESESETEKRRFPRVDITEPLKEKMQKAAESNRERSKERHSPDRDRSGYRSRSLTPGSGYEEEQTKPKSILKDRSGSRSKSPSLERGSPERMYRDMSPRHQRPLDAGSERSPRSSLDRVSGNLRSPRSPRSPRLRSPLRDEMEGATSPGRQMQDSDPNRRLVRVLNRELELLKLKMDVLEKTNLSDDTELEDFDKITKRLNEKVQGKLKSPESISPRRQRSRSPPDYMRGRMFRKKADEDASSSSFRSRSDSRMKSTQSPDRFLESKSHSLQDLSVSDVNGRLTISPTRKGKAISLGYNSPIRKVSEEIWGMDSSDNVGYDPKKIDKWKQLVTKTRVSDSDVLEIKQALATAIAENDILQAKLKNANVEINEKMSKTNDVLNDCRAHLARSQAENMELRTQFEKEKARTESSEVRVRDLEKQLTSAKASHDELESELERTVTLLTTSKKEIPTIQSLSDERDTLKEVLANTQRENTKLKEDIVREKKLTGKQQNMIGDLKTILDDARDERKQLFLEISKLQKQGQLSKVTGIIGKYIDEGLYDDDVEEPPNGYTKSHFADTVQSPRIESYSSSRAAVDRPSEKKVTSTPTYRSRSESLGHTRRSHDEPLLSSSPSKSSSFNVSGIAPFTPTPSKDRGDEYDFEEISPSVPSSVREIYPHRKSQSYRSNFTSYDPDKDDIMDDLEVQRYLSKPVGKLDFDRDLDESYSQRAPRKNFRQANSPSRSKSPMGRGLSFSDFNEDKKSRRQLLYSPYLMNTDSGHANKNKYNSARRSPYENSKEAVDSIIQSPVDNRYRNDYKDAQSQNVLSSQNDNNDKNFLKALEYAVQQENNSSHKYYDDLDLNYPVQTTQRNSRMSASFDAGKPSVYRSANSPGRSNSALRGILKNAKSETNLSIKEGMGSPQRRSLYSHSASPARPSVKDNGPYGTSRFGSSKYTNEYSSSKPFTSGKPLFSAPTKRQGIIRNPNDLFDDSMSPGRSISPIRYQHQPLGNPPILSEEDRRYADLLIEKYTKQHGFGRSIIF